MKENDIEKMMRKHSTSLFHHCTSGNLKKARAALKRGEDINHRDGSGMTALISACQQENEEIVRFLVDNRADVLIKENLHHSALFEACSKGNASIAKILIDKESNIADLKQNQIDRLFGWTC